MSTFNSATCISFRQSQQTTGIQILTADEAHKPDNACLCTNDITVQRRNSGIT